MDRQMGAVRAEEQRVYKSQIQKDLENDLIRFRERATRELGKMSETVKKAGEISDQLPGSHVDLIKMAGKAYYALAMACNKFASDISDLENHFEKMK